MKSAPLQLPVIVSGWQFGSMRLDCLLTSSCNYS